MSGERGVGKVKVVSGGTKSETKLLRQKGSPTEKWYSQETLGLLSLTKARIEREPKPLSLRPSKRNPDES